MATTSSKYFSIRFTQMYMKVTGFWDGQTKKERLRLRINFTYMLLVLLGSLWNELLDFYYSRDDLYVCKYERLPKYFILCCLFISQIVISIFNSKKFAGINIRRLPRDTSDRDTDESDHIHDTTQRNNVVDQVC